MTGRQPERPTRDQPPHPLPLDIVTAVLPEASQHLPETASSIAATKTLLEANGGQVRWHLVLDGTADEEHVDRTVRDAADSLTIMGRRYGVSTARNTGLINCTAALLMPLDGDDLISPDGVLRTATLLTERPEIGWASGATDICNESATRTHPEEASEAADRSRPPRHWPAGTLTYAPERPWVGDSSDAFCPSAVIMRSHLVWAAGGWPASPAAEDKALLLKVSALSPGIQTRTPLLTYRIWDQQATASDRYSPRMIELGGLFNRRTLAAFPPAAH